MRLLHTSDWHLGRTFHGAPLLGEQVAALEAMVGIVADLDVDVVLVAGDLYDRQIPAADAVDAMSEALCRLRDAGAVVVAITGNHDSPSRLRFADSLLASAGVHIAGNVRRAGAPVILPATDGGPDLAVYPIPYLEPETARTMLAAPDARTHDAILRLATQRCRTDLAQRPGLRSVVLAHAFAAGGEPCDSERVLRVGGSDRVSLGCFDGFDYVALGHLHGRQVFGDGRMRYAGSPLPYSFSERDQRKGVEIVDLAADGTVTVQTVPLTSHRGLAAVHGTLDELLSSARWDDVEDHWIAAELTDQLLPRDAMSRLRARFPFAVRLEHAPPVRPGSTPSSYRERVAGRDDLTLVTEFVEHVTGALPDDEDLEVCGAVIDEVAQAVPG